MAGATDWPMWGGTPSRNMVSAAKGLPDKWDVKTKTNVKWVSDLGSQTYGNTTVAGGKVFVGTNNELLRDKQQIGDRGVLMAFKQDTGEFLWQITHEKVAAGRVNDWPFQGIASSPLVEGDKIYYVSNRGEVMCLDTEGFRDNNENDGPVTDEKLKTPNDADVVWKFDMMEEVGAFPHNLSNSSPVVHGDLIYVMTSNGQDESHVNIPSPKAPAIIAIEQDHRQAGVGRQLGLRQDPARPVVVAVGRHHRRRGAGGQRPGRRLDPRLRGDHRQEAVGVRHQPEGLGVAEDAQRGDQHAGHRRRRGLHLERPGSRSTARASATPTPSTPPSAATSPTTGRLWHYDKIRRSMSTPAIADGLIYWPDFSGFLHCLDAEDRPGLLDARHVRRHLGLADGRRRQGLSR